MTEHLLSGILENIIEQNGPVIYGPGFSKSISPFQLKKLRSGEKEDVEKAKEYAMRQSIKSVLVKQSQTQQACALLNLKRQQTLSLLNRIYVGSIPYDVPEGPVKDMFNPFGPIKAVTMSWDGGTTKHKGYGFIEFEYPESAILAIEIMNGYLYLGRPIKVGRPTNLPNPEPMIKQLTKDNNLEKRIFVAGVHEAISDLDLTDVFGAFGTIVHCKLETEFLIPNKHRGVAYIDYESEQSAMDAITSMNKFNLGGKTLKVCRAVCPTEFLRSYATQNKPNAFGKKNLPNAVAIAAAAATAQALAKESEQLSSDERVALNKKESEKVKDEMDISPIDSPKNDDSLQSKNDQEEEEDEYIKLGLLPPECIGVLMLTNMIEKSEIDNDLAGEIEEECSEYGIVRKIHIHTNEDDDDVRIFVQYSHPSAVSCAITSLTGRYFGGKMIVATEYDPIAFQLKDYSK